MTDYSPAVKVTNGNSCGTATHVYRDARYSYWLTNAHVAGTRIGQEMILERYDTVRTRYRARNVAAAYSRTGTTDMAVLRTEAVHDMPYVGIAKRTRPSPATQHSGGHPRCSPTIWKHRYPGRTTNTTQYSTPNSIGGESGSGILSTKHNVVVALLTWSANGYCLAQKADHVYDTLRTRIMKHEPLPRNAIVACDQPQPASNGIYGHTNDLPAGMFVDIDDETAPPYDDDDNDEPPADDDGCTCDEADDARYFVPPRCPVHDDDDDAATPTLQGFEFDWELLVKALETILFVIAQLSEREGRDLAERAGELLQQAERRRDA